MTSAQILHPIRCTAPEPMPHPHEIAAWLDEVRLIIGSLATRPAKGSEGQEQWILQQRGSAAEALEALECLICEAADADETVTDELEWLHTQVCAVADALNRGGSAGDRHAQLGLHVPTSLRCRPGPGHRSVVEQHHAVA